jgi:type VI secretion system secreted protein Hcp
MAIYMKFGSVNGAVTTDGFKDWIELTSFQFGVGRAVGTAARGSTTRESSEPSISEVTVTKVMDTSSNKLFTDAVAGDFSTKVTIKLTTTTKNAVTTFLAYELTDCGLSGYSASSGGDAPQESLSLNFTKIQISYTGLNAKTTGSPDVVGYDLTQMKTT